MIKTTTLLLAALAIGTAQAQDIAALHPAGVTMPAQKAGPMMIARPDLMRVRPVRNRFLSYAACNPAFPPTAWPIWIAGRPEPPWPENALPAAPLPPGYRVGIPFN